MKESADSFEKTTLEETLAKLGVTEGDIAVEDKGALDCAIRARVQTAVLRGAGDVKIEWGRLQ